MTKRKSLGIKRIKTKRFKIKSIKPPAKVIRAAAKKRRRSTLELKIYGWLKDLGIAFVKEKAISKCHVDIFIEPNICIEVNGCYWHRHSKCYPEASKENTATRRRDSRRHAFIRSRGYVIIPLWECVINSKPSKVKHILKQLGEKK